MQRIQELNGDLLAFIIMGMQWNDKIPKITAPDALRIKKEYYNLLK